MKRRLTLILPSLSLGLVACANPVDLEPTTLEEAELVLAELDARLGEDPNDEDALASMRQLEPALDRLNGLVASVELEPGHEVAFYEYAPGAIGIGETHPEGTRPLIAERPELAGLPAHEVYRELTGDDAPPALLEASRRETAQVEAADPAELPTPPVGADVDATRAALGSSGSFFRDNYCFTQGDANYCWPNSAHGGYVDLITRTSFLTLAPYDGHVTLRFSYDGVVRHVSPVYQGEVWSGWWRSAQRRNCVSNIYGSFCVVETIHGWHRWEVLHASGDRFHWTVAARFNCNYQTCDYWPL